MRISDWSSDVCSSDLLCSPRRRPPDGPGSLSRLETLSRARRSPAHPPQRPRQGRRLAAHSGEADHAPAFGELPSLFHLQGKRGLVATPPGLVAAQVIAGAEQAEIDDRHLPAGEAAGSPCREDAFRSEEHTSELQSLMRISYAVFCLKKKKT